MLRLVVFLLHRQLSHIAMIMGNKACYYMGNDSQNLTWEKVKRKSVPLGNLYLLTFLRVVCISSISL